MKVLSNLELKWGGIFSATMIVWLLIEKLAGWHDARIHLHATMTNIFAIPAIAVYVFALLDIRKNEFAYNMTWQQGFLSGVKISLVVAMLSPLVQIIFNKLISPEYFSKVIEYALTQGQDRKALEDYFNLTSYMIQAGVGSFIMGVVTSAVVAIFVKSKRQ